jgi:hypothetical protein
MFVCAKTKPIVLLLRTADFSGDGMVCKEGVSGCKVYLKHFNWLKINSL